MRLPNSEHESRPWLIREIAKDFTLEDVWGLSLKRSGPHDLDKLLELVASSDPAHGAVPERILWGARDLLGKWFNLGRISEATEGGGPDLPIPGTSETSLVTRLPPELVGTADGIEFRALPFTPLYRTENEFAAEVSNRTVHGVMHLALVEQADGRQQGQMAVYVKPRGPFGRAYMAFIKPFRYAIVYPALTRQFEQDWAKQAT
ncbi:MAG: hypothetical protein QOJ72_1464 [Nocardioidaceae bacterium]|jgi:hypothetical protein|nr:hypothetical protein [Nocardioidaceae bacterium]